MRVALDDQGWPAEEAECLIDFRVDNLDPDGAIVDQAGNLWIAQWGASRVTVHAPDGRFLMAEHFAAPHLTCPSSGGQDGQTLFVTSARCELEESGKVDYPYAGAVFTRKIKLQGQRENRVLL